MINNHIILHNSFTVTKRFPQYLQSCICVFLEYPVNRRMYFIDNYQPAFVTTRPETVADGYSGGYSSNLQDVRVQFDRPNVEVPWGRHSIPPYPYHNH